MQFIAEYWWMILVAILAVALVGYCCYVFFKLPSETQIEKVKQWLLYAVAQAEKELGSGTGKLKLRYVYDMFVNRFSYLSKYISFELFSQMVDQVLDEFEKILETNDQVKGYIEGGEK